MHADGGPDEFAHAVQARGKEFQSGHRAAPVPGVGRGVRGFAAEFDDELDESLRAVDRDLGLIAGMPGQTDVEVFEQPLADHVYLAAHRFLGGRTVEADRALELSRAHQLLDGQGRSEGRRAQQVVPAALARRAGLQGFLHGLGFLRQARQGVVFAEDADDRPALAVARHERGRHSRDSAFDREALLFGIVRERLRRSGLEQGGFGEAPDRSLRSMISALCRSMEATASSFFLIEAPAANCEMINRPASRTAALGRRVFMSILSFVSSRNSKQRNYIAPSERLSRLGTPYLFPN